MTELRVERLAAGGETVARAEDGRVVFVTGAVPGETVRVEIVEARPRFLRARVLEVLASVDDRVEPPCPHFEACGGCTLQHFAPVAQARAKLDAAREAVARIARGAVDDAEVEADWTGEPYGYRARARLRVEAGKLGYRAARSHALVEVERCPILHPALESSLSRLAAALPPAGRGELWITAANERVAAWARLDERAVELDVDGVTFVPPGEGLPVEDVAGPAFVGPATFAQANPAGNDALLETAARWTPRSRLALELYSGSGNFTRVLEAKVDRVIAAEVDADAVRLAERVRAPTTSLWRLDAARAVERARSLRPDLVFADPPRTGLDRAVAERLVQLQPAHLIYVSCDPGTFARDVSRLAAAGYRVDRLRYFDMYPQTPHVEVMGCLSAPNHRAEG